MNSIALRQEADDQTGLAKLLHGVWSGSRALSSSAMLMSMGFALCFALSQIDARLFQGVSVWEKPAKFFFSLALHLATVAWAISLLDPVRRNSRGIRWAIIMLLGAAWFELFYITLRAAQGEASHFSTATTTTAIMYALMGVASLVLTGVAAYVGYRLWRQPGHDILREATGLGLLLGAILGTVTAGYMSSQTGHAVGGAIGDANGLPFFHWSTTGGDLRVAHFVGLHAMQIVPLAALSGKRSVIFAVSLTIVLLTAGTFVQAISGVPLLRV